MSATLKPHLARDWRYRLLELSERLNDFGPLVKAVGAYGPVRMALVAVDAPSAFCYLPIEVHTLTC